MKLNVITKQFWLISVALIVTITLQLVATPMIARADDGTPPPPPATDQVVPTDTPPAQSQDAATVAPTSDGSSSPANDTTIPAVNDQVVPTETPTAQPPDVTTVPSASDGSSEVTTQAPDGTIPAAGDQAVSTETATLNSENGVATPPAGDGGSSEVVSPPKDGIINALPENVDLVMLGANGQPEPLVSQAAVNALNNSDPFWCPDGTDPVGGGCTSYATFTDLLTGLQGVGSQTNGTVYVQAGVYGGPESQITFNGNTLSNIGNLSLIGGWDLTAATPNQPPLSFTIFNIPVSIINWAHDVSVQDIVVAGATGSGLTVQTTGQASVSDVMTVNNTKDGVHIEAGDSVTLTNVQADNNGDDGVDISSNTNAGSISLDNVHANYNTTDGIRIYSKQKSSISVTNSISGHNGGNGLDLQSPHEVANCTYSEVFVPAGTTQDVFPYANIVGPTLMVFRTCTEPIRQSLTIDNSQFNNNSGNGIYVYTTGNFRIGSIMLGGAPVTTNDNGQNGASLYFFSNYDTSFPWAYYKKHAEELAGGPATLMALGSVEETVPMLGVFNSANNQGQNYSYYTDGPGISCGFPDDGYGYFCVSPPGMTPIMGGENLDLSSDSSSGSGNSGSGKSSSRNEPLCAKNSIAILQLPNNDNVTVFCPISGQISVKSIGKKGLPASVPDATTLVSALNVGLSKDGKPTSVITDGGHLKVSFAIPSDLAGKNFAIMFWDTTAGKWVELPAFTADGSGKALSTPLYPDNSGDDMQVLEGTKALTDVGMVEASVNFPGTFILVVK